jgi:hypothetical protein
MATVGFIIAALLFIFAIVLFACSRSPHWNEVMHMHDGNEAKPEKHVWRNDDRDNEDY